MTFNADGREFERLCLHAYRLGFPHPTSNDWAEFEIAAPASLTDHRYPPGFFDLPCHPAKDLKVLSRSIKCFTRHRVCHFSVRENRFAIYDHGREPYRVLMRLFEGCLVADRIFVKDDQVSGKALADQAAVLQAECLSGK